jgi:hypothetical protein
VRGSSSVIVSGEIIRLMWLCRRSELLWVGFLRLGSFVGKVRPHGQAVQNAPVDIAVPSR